jgi:hypothetical protein
MPWEWENSESTVTLPVSLCRDLYIFDVDTPRQNLDTLVDRAKNGMLEWQRKSDKDDRYFYIPVTIIDLLPKSSNLFRDVMACISQMYVDSGYPESKIIKTSLRQIADNMGLSFNGNRAEEINNALAFAKYYRIKPQTLYKVEGKNTIKYEREFIFIQGVDTEVEINGVPVNPKIAKKEIMLSDRYAQMLHKSLPKAPVPVAALRIANSAPRQLITPMKNFIYNLAALIPRSEPSFSLEKLRAITGYRQTRTDRLRMSLENLFDYLTPDIIEYFYIEDKGKYIFKYAGQLRPVTPQSETRYATK